MNKEKFLEMLTVQLQVLDEKEKQDILDEYALHIDMKAAEGLSEEEAIRDFGDFKELVTDILEAYHVNPEYCSPLKVQKKEWKTPDIGKVKEEGIEVCTKAGGAVKRGVQAGKEKCGRGFQKCGTAFQNFGVKCRKIFAKKERGEERMKEKKERHIWAGFVHRCREAGGWCLRVCWNAVLAFFAVMFGLAALTAVFLFGALIILNAQGYPLTGLTLAALGVILIFGALTGLAVSFWKKKQMGKKTLMTEERGEAQYE